MVNANEIIKLSTETIQSLIETLLKTNNAVSISSTKLDNDYTISTFQNEKFNWVSEEEKDDAFINELVWSIFYDDNNMNGSSLVSVIEKIFIK